METMESPLAATLAAAFEFKVVFGFEEATLLGMEATEAHVEGLLLEQVDGAVVEADERLASARGKALHQTGKRVAKMQAGGPVEHMLERHGVFRGRNRLFGETGGKVRAQVGTFRFGET